MFRVLVVDRARNPEDARQVGEAVVGPSFRGRTHAKERMPPSHNARGIDPLCLALEYGRLLKEPPAVQAVAGENNKRWLHSRRQDRERLLDSPRQGLLTVGIGKQIEITANSGDPGHLARRAASRRPVILARQAEAHIHIPAAVDARNIFRGVGNTGEPPRSFVWQSPDQDVLVLRLVLPELIKELERRHLASSQKRRRKRSSATSGGQGVMWRPAIGSQPHSEMIQPGSSTVVMSRNSVARMDLSASSTDAGNTGLRANFSATVFRTRSSADRYTYISSHRLIGAMMSPKYASAASCNNPQRESAFGTSSLTMTEC